MSGVAITGIGETPFLRKGDRSQLAMMADASLSAIADAGLTVADIDGVISNRLTPGADELGHAIGMDAIGFSATCDTGGGTASAGQALLLARLAIGAGLARHVLVPYAIRASKPGGVYALHAREPQKQAFEMPVGYYGQPSYFAMAANRYAHDHGLSEEELASVAITHRAWAAITPSAQRREPLDLDGYRASTMIASPLRIADCSLTTDAGGAYVVSAVERARDLPHPVVRAAAVGIAQEAFPLGILFTQKPCIYAYPGWQSAALAFAEAGVGAGDLDFAQLYDGFSISALVQAEMLGLCGEGEGGRFYAAGHARPGGRMPVNTSGGHMSGGYVPGITLLIEAVRQLRGGEGARQVPGARIGAVTGLGGNSHSTTILVRE